MDEYQIDYLKNHKDYKVCQKKDMYHFNTDTCLLGEFINIKKDEHVLDVGTNNGALLIYIAKKDGIPYGIEINKEAIDVCNKTLQINNIKANIICDDFSNYQSKSLFDVIISNPPYFDTKDEKEKNKNNNKKIARHEESLTLENLIKSINNNLKKDGRLYLVYRANKEKTLKETLTKYDFYINHIEYVYNSTKNEPITILIEASHIQKELIISKQSII